MSPLATLIGSALAAVIVLLLAAGARRRGRRRLDRAAAAGPPLTADLRAYLIVPVRRGDPGPAGADVPAALALRWQRARRGTIQVRPGSVRWQPRSRRDPGALDLTGARLTGAPDAADARRGRGLGQDLGAGYQVTLRRDDERFDFYVRKPAAALIEAGLAQARPAADPAPGQTSLSA